MNSKVHTGNEQEFENSSLSGNEEFLLEILDDNDEMIRCIEELIDDQNELCNEMPGRDKKPRIESENSEEEDERNIHDDVEDLCSIRRLRDKFNKRFNLFSSDHLVTLKGLERFRFIDILPLFIRIFQQVLNKLCQNVEPHDRVRIVIIANDFLTFFIKRTSNARKFILGEITKVLQSHMDLLVGDGLTFNIQRIAMPFEGGSTF
ncbi:uncharacterized protein [Antedon mediterranea]|uniref:uncharacterized protein isoform X1 n=1 Tax=Antedon mediterranea TaxID=105859 RepID=UPI003AF5262E